MKSILCTLVLCMFMGGGRISVFGKTVRPAAESGCSASPAGSEKISKQRARAYRKKQAVWQKAQAEREAALREAQIERDKAMRERQMALREAQLEREAALREARIERDKAMRERQMALREARIEREAAMREACAERRKSLPGRCLAKAAESPAKDSCKAEKGVTQGRAGPATGMGAFRKRPNRRRLTILHRQEMRVGCPRGPVAVGYAGEPDKAVYFGFRCSAVFYQWLSLRSGPSVLPVGNGAGANSGRAVGIAFPDIRIVRVARCFGSPAASPL